ncbi:MAG: hypothetical protein ILA23_02370 [Bacteroidales bacterium]|nr:hypothetical protein [Bacteroidales bacterium]
MMKLFVVAIACVLACAARAQTPEELYEAYSTPETRAVLERFEEAERRSQEAEAAAKARRTLALGGAILIGLIPLGYIGREIIRKKSWRDNPGGTVRALGVGLTGGVVLFGLNYGIFLLKIKMGDAFHIALAFLIVAALVAGAIYLMKKKQS